jgi:hypothetical protein
MITTWSYLPGDISMFIISKGFVSNDELLKLLVTGLSPMGYLDESDGVKALIFSFSSCIFK